MEIDMTQNMPSRDGNTQVRDVSLKLAAQIADLENEETRLEETIRDTNLTKEQRDHLDTEMVHHKEQLKQLRQVSEELMKTLDAQAEADEAAKAAEDMAHLQAAVMQYQRDLAGWVQQCTGAAQRGDYSNLPPRPKLQLP
jgi:chromosome segregation ATPase